MIGEYTLKILCDKYNISSENVINKNNNILTYDEYLDIDKTLNYLINELKVSGENIEKCPSILYRNVAVIEKNIDYLKQQNVSFSSIESCLHVLSTEPINLKDTYKYIEENYGKEAINKNTSILSCDKDLIIEVEKLGLAKSCNLAIAVGIAFGSTTLEEVIDIINSEEYKEHPELFTSQTLANAKIKDIKDILHSEEYKEHPELFTSQTLAFAKIGDISTLLQMPYWSDIRFKHLLTSSVLSRAKQMINKLPVLIKIAEYYEIDEYLTTSFLLVSPSQNFALINYLNDNNIPLIINEKLNSVFGKQPGLLKKKYGIDIKKQMKKYDFSKFDFDKKDVYSTQKIKIK